MNLKTIFNSIYFTWFVLAIPSIAMLLKVSSGVEPGRFVHGTGEFAARFMIIAMMLTPLLMLFPRSKAIRWLINRRRAFGVAAFCYALAHTLLYLIDTGSLKLVLEELWLPSIFTGWAAFAIFIPLAVTSNQTMVRKLKTKWKPLQRFVYGAAVLTLVHWILIHNHLGPVLAHFLPLATLEAYRVYRHFTDRRISLSAG